MAPHIKKIISWRPDLIAAVSVAAVAIPQALAYATMAGLPAYVGLYAQSVPTLLAAIFGTSKILSTGPVAVISLLTASVLGNIVMAHPSQAIFFAVALALMVGVIQIVFGLVRLGSFINFIGYPVMIGFTTAAAFIIGFSQVPKLLGIHVMNNSYFYQTIVETLSKFRGIDIATAIIGIGSLVALLLLKRYFPKVPAALLVVVAGIIFSKFFHYTGPIVGNIPPGFSLLNLQEIGGINFGPLLSGAFIIAIVGFMQGMSVIKTLAVLTRDKVNPNKELVAQGIANVSSGLIGSYPVAGSVSCTALNYAAGARTKMASILLGIITIITLFLFTPLLYYITLASLAAVIIDAVINIFNFNEIKELLQRRPRDGSVAVITLSSTLLFAPHLDIGILIGIVASILAHLHRSATPHIEIFFCHDKDYLHSHHYHLRTYPSNKKVLGVAIHAGLNFTNASFIHDRIMQEIHNGGEKPKYVLLIGNAINYIDVSAEKVLHELHGELKEEHMQLLFAGLKPHVEDSLRKTKLHTFLGGANIYPEINLALRAISEREHGK